MRISVVIPTHNRPEKLAELVAGLRRQDLPADGYEIIVVDDGSTPPVTLPTSEGGPRVTLIRTRGGERSAARNAGAAMARGELLVFLDDDMIVGPEFLECHLRAHREWPKALAVGAVRLPGSEMGRPFTRFRQALEFGAIPTGRGPVGAPNFCTAQNMSVRAEAFCQVGGFDPGIVSAEDQDFALRHSAGGDRIVFLPEAVAVHNDGALDIRSYCRRMEWGYENMIPFCRRHPALPDNVERERVNGHHRRGEESARDAARKLVKSTLMLRPLREVLYWLAAILERIAPESRALDRTYRTLLGVAIFAGYRAGLKRFGPVSETSPGAGHALGKVAAEEAAQS